MKKLLWVLEMFCFMFGCWLHRCISLYANYTSIFLKVKVQNRV